LERHALKLRELGEVAGIDYDLRASATMAKLKQAAQTLKGTGELNAMLARQAKTFAAEVRKREKSLAAVRRLCQQDAWEQAETDFFEQFDELHAASLWFDRKFTEPLLKRFAETRSQITEKTLARLRERAVVQLNRELQTAPVDTFALVQGLRQAAQELRTTGMAEFAGRKRKGPEVLAAAVEEWRRAQSAAAKQAALTWYLKRTPAVEIQGQILRLASDIENALIETSLADAAHCEKGALPALYSEYLTVCATAAAREFDGRCTKTMQKVVAALAAEDPQLNEEVSRYEAATAGILAWHERLAAAKARVARQGIGPLDELFHTAAANRPNVVHGLFDKAQKPMTLLDPLPELVGAMAGSLKNKKVTVTRVIGSEDADLPGQTPLAGGFWARLPTPRAVQDAGFAALKSDLLTGEGRMPLSLAAAMALASVEQGCAEEVGGDLTGFEIESHLVQIAESLNSSPILTPLGVAAGEELIEPARQVVVRFDIEPKWFRYRHLFIAR
jgi:hypothetical protein